MRSGQIWDIGPRHAPHGVANLTFFDQVHDFSQGNHRYRDFSPGIRSNLNGQLRRGGQAGFTKQRPEPGMRGGNAGDHSASLPKPRNISRRFSSISSTEGADPYLASIP